MPDIYILLGAAQSGRREILKYLIDNALPENEKAVVYISQNDPCFERDVKLAQRADTKVIQWMLANNRIHTVNVDESEAGFIFFLTDGRQNPIDQLEAIKEWLEKRQWYITRIISVVNCELAYQYPPLVEWFNAIIHFSDYVLLTKRENVPQKWINDFLNTFKKECYPCVFEYVKKDGKVNNAIAVLDSEIRRMSLAFDPDETIVFEAEDGDLDLEDAAEGLSENEEDMPFNFDESLDELSKKTKFTEESLKDLQQIEDAEEFLNEDLTEDSSEEEEEEEEIPEEPYFEKNLTGGRKKKIPDIQEFLP